MTSLRAPLSVNAALSLASGAFIALAPGVVGDWLGFQADGWLRLVGLVLVAHGTLLTWAVRRPEPAPLARLNLLAIAPYPVLMIVLVATSVIDRPLGQGLALLDGAVVGAIALWHWMSLREAHVVPQPQTA